MSNLFGTDGLRGVYGKEVTPIIAFNLGRSIGVLSKFKENKAITVGFDTRLSCEVLWLGLVSGILSQGIAVINLGLVTTPAVSFITRQNKYAFGVMITASHNSAEYNGIKLFNENGFKLSKKQEDRVISTYENIGEFAYEKYKYLGKLSDGGGLIKHYEDFIKSLIKEEFFNYKVCFDCSNGAVSRFARSVFADKFAQVSFINTSGDGLIVNKACGATDLNCLRQFILANKYDFGFAFDGDADRIILVNMQGDTLDGDDILAILAEYFLNNEKLNKKAVVGTVLTNMGLERHLNGLGVTLLRTDVGDKYVSDCIIKNELQLGGEPAGHIILNDLNATGDGLLCAAILLLAFNAYEQNGRIKNFSERVACTLACDNIKLVFDENTCNELCGINSIELSDKVNQNIPDNFCEPHTKNIVGLLTRTIKMPQYYLNIKVSNEKKQTVLKDMKVKSAIKKYTKMLGKSGRLVVRPSGTEPVVRIMIESEDEKLAKKILSELEERITDY